MPKQQHHYHHRHKKHINFINETFKIIHKRLFLIYEILIFLSLLIATIFYLTKDYQAIDVHEHIESQAEADIWISIMRKTEVKKTILAGAPKKTITLEEKDGFTNYDKNNEEVLALAKKYPNKFIAFCTINPLDQDKLEKSKKCIADGGKGLELYSGDSTFYNLPLDDSSMFPVYNFAQEEHLPIIFNVNLGKYENEFGNVMQNFPNLKVNCPHFCLSSTNSERLEKYFQKYSNFYTDISFGYYTFMGEGLLRFSEDPEKYQNLIKNYSDRFLFSTDLTITNAKIADSKLLEELPQFVKCYRDFLEKEKYTCPPLNDYLKKRSIKNQIKDLINQETNDEIEINGLHLPREILKKIYIENALNFLGK